MGVSDAIARGMSTLAQMRALAPAAPALSLAQADAAAQAAMAGPMHGLDDGLADLAMATGAQAGAMAAHLDASMTLGLAAAALSADGRYVSIDASVKPGGDAAALLSQMQALGLVNGASYAGAVSGDLPVSALPQLSGLSLLGQAHAALAEGDAGAVQSQGVAAERADLAQSAHPDITGAGLRLGILSTSFDTNAAAATHMAGDIASGDLPADTVVLSDAPNGTDEGRAMAQLAHDVAPGASIDFLPGGAGQAALASDIIQLAQRGDKVIVDDLRVFSDLMYQDGPVAQAIATAVNTYGVTYFASAGNNSNHGWEGAWVDGSTFTRNGSSYTSLAFAQGQDYLPVTLANAGEAITFLMQWDETGASAGGAGATSDLDVFVYTDAAMTQLYASATSNQIGADPVSNFTITSNAANQTFYIRIAYNSTRGGGAPPEVRLISADDGAPVTFGTTASNINPGTVHGHNDSAAAIGVGEAVYSHTPAFDAADYPDAQLDKGSSVGFDKITWSPSGARLAAPVYTTPSIVGVDGVATTFFPSTQASGPYAFYGTSAAAPDVAAVALLMLQANAALTRNDVLALLQDSALDMDDPYTPGFDAGFDDATGAGLVQADLAVNFALGGVISNASQTTLNGTHLNDVITGSAADDTLQGGAGDDQLDGGGGTNTAVYSGRTTDYRLARTADGGFTITDLRPNSPDGVDTLHDVQRLQFSDALTPTPAQLDGPTATALQAVLRVDPSAPVTAALTVTLAALSDAAAVTAIVQATRPTTEVAVLAYQFFTGHTPTAAGVDYLVAPTGPNANNLNSAYYGQFSAENRYINFAVNLGKIGEGAAAFQAAYGALSLADATSQAYAAIFGMTPSADKVQHLLHDAVPNGLGGDYEREAYFAAYGGDGPSGLGTKAAMVGWLLSQGAQADVGTYALSDDAFLTDVANGRAGFGVDLVGSYAKPGYSYTGG